MVQPCEMWRTDADEGFLNYVEGGVIFSPCLFLMLAEMSALAAARARSLDDIFDLGVPRGEDFRGRSGGRPGGRPLVDGS